MISAKKTAKIHRKIILKLLWKILGVRIYPLLRYFFCLVIKGSESGSIPRLVDLDLVGPKTWGSDGSGNGFRSATLAKIYVQSDYRTAYTVPTVRNTWDRSVLKKHAVGSDAKQKTARTNRPLICLIIFNEPFLTKRKDITLNRQSSPFIKLWHLSLNWWRSSATFSRTLSRRGVFG